MPESARVRRSMQSEIPLCLYLYGSAPEGSEYSRTRLVRVRVTVRVRVRVRGRVRVRVRVRALEDAPAVGDDDGGGIAEE